MGLIEGTFKGLGIGLAGIILVCLLIRGCVEMVGASDTEPVYGYERTQQGIGAYRFDGLPKEVTIIGEGEYSRQHDYWWRNESVDVCADNKILYHYMEAQIIEKIRNDPDLLSIYAPTLKIIREGHCYD